VEDLGEAERDADLGRESRDALDRLVEPDAQRLEHVGRP
jgi:hypothetical protein